MKNRLNKNHIEVAVNLQKRIMECFGEMIPHEFDDEKSFEVGANALGFVLSNFLHSYGLKNAEKFMEDIKDFVCEVHADIGKYSQKMFYKDNKKVSESGIQ